MDKIERLKYGRLIDIRNALDDVDDKLEKESNPAYKANLKLEKIKLLEERAY